MKRCDSVCRIQIQFSIQKPYRRVDTASVQLTGDHQQLAGCPEPVDLPGSGVHRQRCGPPAAGRGEALHQRRQVMAARDDASARHAQRRRVLRRRRLRRTDVAASTRAA